MEGRRHSVDLPISRTLIALRRVRSLRDPSTNSMSKIASFLNNGKWETNSNNGISLQFINACEEDGSDRRNSAQVGNIGCLVTANHVEGLNREEIGLGNNVEESDSCNGVNVGSSPLQETDYSGFKRECKLRSFGCTGDRGSRVGSQCPSHDDAVSSRGTSLFEEDEGIDLVYPQHRGCGISCCWSKSPRLGESNVSSEVDELPFLSSNIGNTVFSGRECWKLVNSGIAPYSETPRSLIQKFRPKSFDELVGQEVVSRSLLGAISNGRIASFYLFHGPRGTGKTSASRIFAAALNCLSVEERKPCGLCQECVLFFSGRSRDVKEVDSLRINRSDRVRSLIKNAVSYPVSSRFKIFIVDECQLLHGDTWTAILNNRENLSQCVVFVMVTPDLDKLPRIALSYSQKYHFPKIKDNDISNRLGKICVEEGVIFDQAALDFIAAKSNGSLRDAEMMLDQLSLLGKRITMSLAYELIGTVSDAELLDLLDLALSSDTSNTVIMARELMRSKIDPLQLTSQLANLIMDILAGTSQEGCSEARRKFCKRHTSEADLQKLSHALRVLSETEKHLRVSKSQTTWLTVALLQLSSAELNQSDSNHSKSCSANSHEKEDDSHSTSSTGEKKCHVTCMCTGNKSYNSVILEDCNGRLETIWKSATDLCQSSSLKKFLRKHGKLSSLFVNQGLAIAELEFSHPNHVSRAEKSWKLIASCLQLVLGCNVEIRINLTSRAPSSTFAKVKASFSIFSCSRRTQQRSHSTIEQGSDDEISDHTSEKPMVRALRNSEGNVLSTGTTSSRRSYQEDATQTPGCAVDSLREEARDLECIMFSSHKPGYQPSCFPRVLRLQRKSNAVHESKMASGGKQQRFCSVGRILPCTASK